MSKQGISKLLHRLTRRLTALDTVLIMFSLLVLATFSQLLSAYETWWFSFFLSILLVMLILAIWRYGRIIWRDARQYRMRISKKSLQVLHQQQNWQFNAPAGELAARAQQFLQRNGFTFRQVYQKDVILISAMKGRTNRFGFFLVHIGFILLCFGVVIDSDVMLRYQLWRSAIPSGTVAQQKSLPGVENASFQGVLRLSDKSPTNQLPVMTPVGERQHTLPFQISLRRVELVGGVRGLQDQYKIHVHIQDSRRDFFSRYAIGVNEPAQYQGYDIYQQSVSDAGTKLHLKVWPLFHARMSALKYTAKVKTERQLQTSKGPINIVFDTFTPKNIVTDYHEPSKRQIYRNLGPKLTFTAKLPDGKAYEYLFYMLPLQQQGRYFFLTGVRLSGTNDYRYLHIPADPEGDIQRFLRFHAIMNDAQQLSEVIRSTVTRTNDSGARLAMTNTMLKMIRVFNHGGYTAMEAELAKYTSTEKLPSLLKLTNKLMRNVFYQLYEKVLQQEHGNGAGVSNSFDIQFFDDALAASAGLGDYGLPLFIQLDDFEYQPAVQLLIAKKPGKAWFVVGCLSLLIGMVFMLYTRHRRLWIWIDNGTEKGQLIFAGMGNRQSDEFAEEFSELALQLKSVLQQ